MPRTRVRYIVRDDDGPVFVNARVYPRLVGTATALTDAYPTLTGGVAAESFVTNGQGEVEFFTDAYREEIDLHITDNAGATYQPGGSAGTFAAFTETVTPTAPTGTLARTVDGAVAVPHKLGANGDEPGAFVCWTADDGYTTFVDYFNLLNTKGIDGTLFLTQNWVDRSGTNGSWNDTYITQAQVQAIADAGHELATHGVAHESYTDYLAANGVAALHALVTGAKSYIESTYGVTVKTGAYPAGHSDARVREILDRSHEFYRGTKGIVTRGPSHPQDVPAVDIQALSEAAIKAHVDTAVVNRSVAAFLVHGGLTAADITKFGNVMDYATSLGVPQGTFHRAMSERTMWRSAGAVIETKGGAFHPQVRTHRLELTRSDLIHESAFFDIEEATNIPHYDSVGTATFEFRKALRSLSTLFVGNVYTTGSTTNGSTTVTVTGANFGPADVGRSIKGAGIPAGATIASVTNVNTVVISSAATVTANSVTVIITRGPGLAFFEREVKFFGTTSLVGVSTPALQFELQAGTTQGSISATTWARTGSGGPMTVDTGTGGSNFDVKGAGLRLIGTDGNERARFRTSPAASSKGAIQFTGTGPLIAHCTGTPEAAVTAPVGSLAIRDDGGAATTLYVKESGTGNTGWVAK